MCWGDSTKGGTTPTIADNKKVIKVFSNKIAFTALFSDGTIQSWGNTNGTTTPTTNKFIEIYGTEDSFVGLKSDGIVLCWGSKYSELNTQPTDLSGVSEIFTNTRAVTALLYDGSIVCWGRPVYGGGADLTTITNVTNVFANNYAFCSLDNDGTIHCWGLSIRVVRHQQIIQVIEIYFQIKKHFAVLKKMILLNVGVIL